MSIIMIYLMSFLIFGAIIIAILFTLMLPVLKMIVFSITTVYEIINFFIKKPEIEKPKRVTKAEKAIKEQKAEIKKYVKYSYKSVKA